MKRGLRIILMQCAQRFRKKGKSVSIVEENVMEKTKEKVVIQIPGDIADKISQLNNVDIKYIDRTIVKILKDEIVVEEKLSKLQGGKNGSNLFC